MVSLEISISEQILRVLEQGEELRSFAISSAKNGIGTEEGSFKTPTGNFLVAEKHGNHAPIHTIFKGRQAVGTWSPHETFPDDLVTSRILWLDGLDEENANTKKRYIYIHGTNHEDKIGSPQSCGCIRMLNTDVIELFELVDEGTRVIIRA